MKLNQRRTQSSSYKEKRGRQSKLTLLTCVLLGLACAKECKVEDSLLGFSQCNPVTNTRSAYYYYPPAAQCSSGSDPLPAPISDLNCGLTCAEGEYLALDQGTKHSVCKKCPANTYSTTGVLIDGLMGDWERIQNAKDNGDETQMELPIEMDCYYQDDNLRWVQNIKCTPWHSSGPGSKTIKAQETKAYNTYTAFELTYNAYLRTPGQVTFKYRKDSKTSYIVNGEFKFAVNNKEVLIDYKSTVNTSSDWVEYTYNITEPGMYTLMWIYTKFAEENVTDNLSAEIEYIRITGMEHSPKQCLACRQGWSQEGADRCSLCGANSYIDKGECKQCQQGYYSLAGSIGPESCVSMRSCEKSDILTTYGQCDRNSQMRNVTYSWVQPTYCDQAHSDSVKLPQAELKPCRKCGRGQFFDRSLGRCQYCPDGFYSSKDAHETNTTSDQAYLCLPCPEGKAAVKVLEFDDFEEFPTLFQKRCSVIDSSKASANDCDKFYSWRVDAGKIDSGLGISPGLRQSIVLQVHILDESHGSLEIDYQTLGFRSHERLAVYINGDERYSTTDNTVGSVPSMMKFYLEERLHKVEIAFESVGGDTPNMEAQVLISRVMITGTDQGGAVECKACEPGSIANTRVYMCKKCSKATQPNAQQSDCEHCPQGTFNPFVGNVCKACPAFTYQSKDRTYCVMYDELIVNQTLKFLPHLLSNDEVCEMAQNDDYCTENGILGPIFAQQQNDNRRRALQSAAAVSIQPMHLPQSQHIFFLAQHSEFDMDTYEYHETKDSIPEGYVFALFSMRDASIKEIRSALMQSQDSSILANMDGDCQDELRGMKVKKNLGSIIESVGEFSQDGYTVKYIYGDVCETEPGDSSLTAVRYSSQVRYQCNNMTEEIGWPEFIGTDPLNKCHYSFVWKSRWACSICRPSQVKSIATNCESGQRVIAHLPNDRCIIYEEEPEFYQNIKVSAIPPLIPSGDSASVNLTTSLAQLEAGLFVNDFATIEKCQLQDDFLQHPVIKIFLITVSLIWLISVGVLLIVFCKYRNLKTRYSKLGEENAESPSHSQGGEIEMQTR